jgi:hypothetical protein
MHHSLNDIKLAVTERGHDHFSGQRINAGLIVLEVPKFS